VPHESFLAIPCPHVSPFRLTCTRGCRAAQGRFFDGLSASRKKWHVQSVESAKTPETRQRRIGKSMEMLCQRRAR
jgi:hypothetical protein